MILSAQIIVGLCAAAGFLIVWLNFPAKTAGVSTNAKKSSFPTVPTDSLPPDGDETEPHTSRKEPPPTAKPPQHE